jgi:hypothetical protein
MKATELTGKAFGDWVVIQRMGSANILPHPFGEEGNKPA